jgi:hypothetical protein
MAGLDPAIHLKKDPSKAMDARVKPAHDESLRGEDHSITVA